MLDWLQDHRALLVCLTAASAFLFVATLFFVPALITRIPADYYTNEQRPPGVWARHHPLVRIVMAVVRNVIGAVLVALGLAMLVLPGQGLLTILVGVLMLDFPCKYRFEKWLLSRPRIHAAVNWLRRRAGTEPLRLESRSTSGS